ncbi:unnamed protein product [Rodentolepis nana]|uniref:Uncharacterized protein n=1 Tax=Rodentolepis nana TaxID=102285 RepID=A0A0R3T3P3_RODNA|nr:unnamed protein product [Rodentolepis nana]
MESTDGCSIVSRRTEQLGCNEELSCEVIKSKEMRKKVKKMLKLVNSTRCVPLKLVEVVSGERQIVDGIKENILLRLRESGSKQVLEYNLCMYERANDRKNVEVRLTLKRPTQPC